MAKFLTYNEFIRMTEDRLVVAEIGDKFIKYVPRKLDYLYFETLSVESFVAFFDHVVINVINGNGDKQEISISRGARRHWKFIVEFV